MTSHEEKVEKGGWKKKVYIYRQEVKRDRKRKVISKQKDIIKKKLKKEDEGRGRKKR